MNAPHRVVSPDPHFEALKAITRLQWMLNFEAVATVGDRETAIKPLRSSPGA